MQQLHKIQVKLEFEGHLQFALFCLSYGPFYSILDFCGIHFPFFQNYNICKLLTIGHDYPVPLDKHDSDANFTTPPKGQILKFHNNSVSCQYLN